MRGDITESILNAIRCNPEATNEEISNMSGAKIKTVGILVKRFLDNGDLVNVGEDNVRSLKVMREQKNVQPVFDYKKEILTSMCDKYFDDFLEAQLYTERVEIGKMICRILERIWIRRKKKHGRFNESNYR